MTRLTATQVPLLVMLVALACFPLPSCDGFMPHVFMNLKRPPMSTLPPMPTPCLSRSQARDSTATPLRLSESPDDGSSTGASASSGAGDTVASPWERIDNDSYKSWLLEAMTKEEYNTLGAVDRRELLSSFQQQEQVRMLTNKTQ